MDHSIAIANSSFSELNHLAAHLAQTNLLSKYIRPYVDSPDASFLKTLVPEKLYKRTFGRRQMPAGLTTRHIIEAAGTPDFLLAAAQRIPWRHPVVMQAIDSLVFLRDKQVAAAASKCLTGERMVVAAWGCAEEVFRSARHRVKVLNYSFAHHRAAKSILIADAERSPEFSTLLNSHNWPKWRETQLDAEIELADYILVGSDFVRQTFLGEGVDPSKVLVSEYGADLTHFTPKVSRIATSEVRALFVGQISQRKGVGYLLQAARAIDDKTLKLTLVGQMQGSREVLRPYSDVFEHIPHMPRADLAAVYQSSHVFVFPTLVEGMSLAVLEAMAAGLPVITTPSAGSVVRDGVDGFIVPPGDVAALEVALKKLCNDVGLRETMGRNARVRAEQYSWDRYCSGTTAQLRAMLSAAR